MYRDTYTNVLNVNSKLCQLYQTYNYTLLQIKENKKKTSQINSSPR